MMPEKNRNHRLKDAGQPPLGDAPALNPEQIVPFEDGWMDPATEATHSAAIEPNTDFASNEVCGVGPPDSSPIAGSEPRTSVPID